MITSLRTLFHSLASPAQVCITLFCCTAIVDNSNAAANITACKQSYKDSIVITTTLNIKNRKARVYPDVCNQNLLFAATGKKGKAYQLFVFDMDGKLVTQTRIIEKQTEQLMNIKKGDYLFEVFNDDLRIEIGSIVIK